MMLRDKLSRVTGYCQELGLDTTNEEHRFRWFVASILLAGGVSPQIATNTYRELETQGIVTPESIIEAGWDRRVEVLCAGGYVVYDFATASKLLDTATKIKEKYGSLEGLYEQAKNSRDLERKLQEFKGVGPTTVDTFLRELKGVWEKARPNLSSVAKDVASRLGLGGHDLEEPTMEVSLARIGIDFCKGKQCLSCPVRDDCSDPVDRQEVG
jgi:hypothetical protein